MIFLASDYDDTLTYDRVVSEDNKAAIEEFQKAGNKFIINTGRHLDSIYAECDKYGLRPDYYVGNNGNIIADKDRNTIYMAKFDNALAEEIVEYFDVHMKNDVFYICANDGSSFGLKLYNDGEFFFKDHDEKLEDYLDKEICTMFSQAIDKDQTQMLAARLNQAFAGKASFFNNDPYIDIVQDHHDKATALDYITRLENLDSHQMYTVGDSLNDIAMLSKYDGYAMDHASDFVKGHVNKTVASVADLIGELMGK